MSETRVDLSGMDKEARESVMARLAENYKRLRAARKLGKAMSFDTEVVIVPPNTELVDSQRGESDAS